MMAKVPISGATKVVWQRYCQTVGVGWVRASPCGCSMIWPSSRRGC